MVVVDEPDPTVGDSVFAFDRDDGEGYTDANRWSPRTSLDYLFVDWTGDGVLDLLVYGSASGGTGIVGTTFEVHGLGEPSLDQVFDRSGGYDANRCMKPEIRDTASAEVADSNPVDVTLEQNPKLVLSGGTDCLDHLDAPSIQERCTADQPGDPVECERQVETVELRTADDLNLEDLGEETRTENLEWIREHADDLEKVGYDLSQELGGS